ncbi:MAG: RHS repeat-associated core domain-containing protein [Pirellula sp.]
MKDRGIIVVLANGSSSGSATIPGEMEMIMTNPRGFVTKTKTDRFGLPIEIKYPDGSSEKFERNKHGNPKNHTFPTASGGAGTTTYTYDDRENATQINSPAGVTGIVYDVRSLPISVTQTGRPTQQIARDSYGNAIQVTILPMGGASIAANPDNRYPYMLTYLTNPVDRFDVNNDGFVNQDDQTALQNYVSTNGVAFVNGLTSNGRPVYPDVDGNGIANGSDYAPLASYLASSQLLTENYGYSTGGNNFPRGLLTSHSNTAGETTVYEYFVTGSSKGMLKSIGRSTAPSPNVLAQFEYDQDLNRTATIDFFGRRNDVTYDRLGLPTKVEEQSASGGARPTTRFEYTRMGHLSKVVDPANYVTEVNRAPDGRAITVVIKGAGGLPDRAYTTIYDVMGNVYTETDPLNRVTAYSYDSRDRVNRVTLPNGEFVDLFHNAAGYMTRSVDPSGSITNITYSASGDQTQVSRANPANAFQFFTTTIGYASAGMMSTVTNPLGETTTYRRDAFGRVAAVDGAASTKGSYTNIPRATFAYDTAGRQASQTDFSGQAQIARVDSLGRLSRIETSDPDRNGPAGRSIVNIGPKTRVGNQITQTVNLADGRVVNVTNDLRDRLVSLQMPSLNGGSTITQTSQYDILDQLLSETDFSGASSSYTYDRFGQVTNVRGANHVTGNADTQYQTSFVYDIVGRMTGATSPNGGVTNYQYDSLDRIVAVLEPDPDGNGPLARRTTNWNYNIYSRVVQESSSDGSSKMTFYDSLWRPTSISETGSGSTRFRYDANDQLVELMDSNLNFTRWVYDSMGRTESEEQVGIGTRRWKYTTPGQQREYTDRTGAVTRWEYNAGSQITKEIWPATNTEFVYEYDLRSRLSSITRSSNDRVAWTYNTAGLVTSETTTIPQMDSQLGSPSFHSTMEYSYDTVGRNVYKSHAINNVVDYADSMTYDKRSRLTQTERVGGNGQWARFTYDAMDQIVIMHQGSGSATSNPELIQNTQRDLIGRPTSIGYQSNAGLLASYSMAYVSGSNRLASLTTPAGTTAYSYTANGQLTQAGSVAYTYDGNGNPVTRNGKVTQIGSFNRLLDDGDFTFQYDAEGRTTRRTNKATGETERYEWNPRSQLTKIDVFANASTSTVKGSVKYGYDTLGRRNGVSNETSIGTPSYSKTIDYLLSDGDQIGEILGATGQVTNRFMYGPGVDMVLSEQQFAGGVAQSPQYQLTDHLGTVRGVAQRVGGASSATLVNSVQYDAFGKVTSQSNATNQPHHGFAGRDIEPVGGLTYNRNRYYSTSSGRFISQDPISFAAGDANLYRYVGNKPTMATDPSGLEEHLTGLPLHGSSGYWFSPDGKRSGPEYRGNGWFSPFSEKYDPTKHKSPWFMADPADTSKDLRVRYQNGSPNFNRWVKHTTVNGKYQPISVLITLDNRQNLTDGGRRKADYAAADKEFKRVSGNKKWERTPGYTWHHQTIDPKTGSGQMILVDTKVHDVADHWGPYSLYQNILEAAQAGDKKTFQTLVERAKKLNLLRLTKVAGGVSLVLSAGSAYAGFQKDGTAGAVEAIGKDVSMQEEIGWVIMLPNNMVYRDWLKIDPDKPFDVLVDECLDKRLNGAGVSPVK